MKFIHTAFIFILFFPILHGQYIISGKVKNNQNEKLVNASIFIKDSQYATISDIKGNYKLEVEEKGEYHIVCSYVGYEKLQSTINVEGNQTHNISLEENIYNLDAVNITSNRLEDSDPFSYTTMNQEEIEDLNLGQDVPFLLQYTPSVVVTSDAGAGVGYTGMRVRGSDPTRVNVTINGIPLNDSESQTVFWVDLPDFGSSISDIQIQRGVGTSTNGTGAFGATLALNTKKIYQNNYAEFNVGYGSFNTRKLNVKAGTGLLNNSFYIDGRFSKITSDGFIDRATSDLTSFNITAGKLTKNGSLRFDYFYGKEVTYQAWFGVPQSKFEDNQEELLTHFGNNGSLYETVEDSINLFDSDERYNFYLYENQVDDYKQQHYQLNWTNRFRDNLHGNVTLHYTRGLGFFEQFRREDDFVDYPGLQEDLVQFHNNTQESGNLARRRWLDNHFLGGVTNLQWDAMENVNLHWGAAYHYYDGGHNGNVVLVEGVEDFFSSRRYFDNTGLKKDFNTFIKANYKIGGLSLYGDLQFRNVNYSVEGDDNDGVLHDIQDNLNFFNPKFGASYTLKDNHQLYGSIAVAHREPDRNDYTSTITFLPQSERLIDYELGYRMSNQNFSSEFNLYYMDYKDQLVITGALNDVGSNLRINVPESFRRGIEWAFQVHPFKKWSLDGNITLSQNKIESFDEVIFDFATNDIITINHQDTDITLSPNVISALGFSVMPMDGLQVRWQTKFVGSQFLDNTSNENRKLDSYLLNNLLASYTFSNDLLKHIRLNLIVNNLFDVKYASNGYTFSYGFYDIITENYVYPQAGINFMAGLSVKF